MVSITFSPLANDAEAQTCAGWMAASEPWQTLGFGYPALLRTVQATGRECYLARVDEQPAGFVILNLQGSFVGYIQTICVAPGFRARGVGASMLAFAEERIFRDHPNVFMCVTSFNHGARRLYERLGYVQVGELKDFLVAGHAELLLRKTRGPLSSYTPAHQATGGTPSSTPAPD